MSGSGQRDRPQTLFQVSEIPHFSGHLKKAAHFMDSDAILREVDQLYNVSDRLDALAEQHPLVSEALMSISGSIRNTATLLEVVVATKMTPIVGFDPAIG